MNYSVDEIEGGIAVLIDEDGEVHEVPSVTLSPDVKEGDIVNYRDYIWQKNPEETEQSAARIQALLRELQKKNGK
ncbi:MAG: DUF3006 domain-containing protein [Oscillospiraceae bacterium]|nr:DUF3006 domain-containing protein [Oscillospiraceae bacterium]